MASQAKRLVIPVAADGVAPPPTPSPEPTVEAATTPAVTVPIPFGEGVERWRPLVASIFPAWAVDTVLRVMWCESRGNPNATGAAGEMGLMQIHPRWHADATYDPEGNLRAAYRISSGGTDWSAWTCRA